MNRKQVTPNCWLDGTESIRVQTKEGEKEYKLQKVTSKEIMKLRKSGEPGFVLKIGDDFFYTKVLWNVSLNFPLTAFAEHLCGMCSKCRAVEDELGGCRKVRECSFENYMRYGSSERDALEMSKRIEKYNFIRLGYEIFNAKSEVLSVSECNNFMHHYVRRKTDPLEKLRMQLSLEKLYKND